MNSHTKRALVISSAVSVASYLLFGYIGLGIFLLIFAYAQLGVNK